MSLPADPQETKLAALAGEAERLARQGHANAAARLWEQVMAAAPAP